MTTYQVWGCMDSLVAAIPGLLDEVERLRAVIRETHTDCAEWQAARYNPLRHAPHCKLYEIEP